VPRTKTQPVRLSADLLDQLKAQTAKSGRSIPMEAEHRLRESLAGGSMEEGYASTWARAIGRLTTLLANDFAAGSKSPYEALAAMKLGTAALLSSFLDEWRIIYGERKIESVEHNTAVHAINLALELARKIRHAHEPENPILNAMPPSWLWTTQASLRSLGPEELKEIQAALYLSPESLEAFRNEAQDRGKASNGEESEETNGDRQTR
jgi:hypothetical protein